MGAIRRMESDPCNPWKYRGWIYLYRCGLFLFLQKRAFLDVTDIAMASGSRTAALVKLDPVVEVCAGLCPCLALHFPTLGERVSQGDVVFLAEQGTTVAHVQLGL